MYVCISHVRMCNLSFDVSSCVCVDDFYVCTRVYIHAYMRQSWCVRVRVHKMCMRACPYMHMYVHTHTHTHTHTHKQTHSVRLNKAKIITACDSHERNMHKFFHTCIYTYTSKKLIHTYITKKMHTHLQHVADWMSFENLKIPLAKCISHIIPCHAHLYAQFALVFGLYGVIMERCRNCHKALLFCITSHLGGCIYQTMTNWRHTHKPNTHAWNKKEAAYQHAYSLGYPLLVVYVHEREQQREHRLVDNHTAALQQSLHSR
jgi:hypothetical protein